MENASAGRDVVHVWKAALDLAEPRVLELEKTLSQDERDRAARFHFEIDRARFIVGRGILRAILGRYLGVEPHRLRFQYALHGKPALAPGASAHDLRFNAAHSGGMVLYAVTSGREVGIDVERLRPDFATEAIAERFFSPGEVASLRALPVEARLKAFFDCWTRKEAYIKATGHGLSHPLQRFTVSLAPGAAALLGTDDDAREASRWSLQELSPGPGYAAALAVEGHGWRLQCWEWTRDERPPPP